MKAGGRGRESTDRVIYSLRQSILATCIHRQIINRLAIQPTESQNTKHKTTVKETIRIRNFKVYLAEPAGTTISVSCKMALHVGCDCTTYLSVGGFR